MCAKPNTILAFLLRKRVDQDRVGNLKERQN